MCYLVANHFMLGLPVWEVFRITKTLSLIFTKMEDLKSKETDTNEVPPNGGNYTQNPLQKTILPFANRHRQLYSTFFRRSLFCFLRACFSSLDFCARTHKQRFFLIVSPEITFLTHHKQCVVSAAPTAFLERFVIVATVVVFLFFFFFAS